MRHIRIINTISNDISDDKVFESTIIDKKDMVVENEVESLISADTDRVDIDIDMDEIDINDEDRVELENALASAVDEQLDKNTNYEVIKIHVKIYSCTKTVRKVIQVQIHMQYTGMQETTEEEVVGLDEIGVESIPEVLEQTDVYTTEHMEGVVHIEPFDPDDFGQRVSEKLVGEMDASRPSGSDHEVVHLQTDTVDSSKSETKATKTVYVKLSIKNTKVLDEEDFEEESEYVPLSPILEEEPSTTTTRPIDLSQIEDTSDDTKHAIEEEIESIDLEHLQELITALSKDEFEPEANAYTVVDVRVRVHVSRYTSDEVIHLTLDMHEEACEDECEPSTTIVLPDTMTDTDPCGHVEQADIADHDCVTFKEFHIQIELEYTISNVAPTSPLVSPVEDTVFVLNESTPIDDDVEMTMMGEIRIESMPTDEQEVVVLSEIPVDATTSPVLHRTSPYTSVEVVVDKKDGVVQCEAHIDLHNTQQHSPNREKILLQPATPVSVTETEICVSSPTVVEVETDGVEPVEILLQDVRPDVVDQEEIVVRMTSQGELTIQQQEEVILEDVHPEEIILYVVYF